MIQYVCDTCGTVKEQGEEWIVGLAAENVGLSAARREVVLDAVWTEDRAKQILAVHFCSDECRDDYMSRLFSLPGGQPAIEQVTERVTTVKSPKRRATRTVKRVTRRKAS